MHTIEGDFYQASQVEGLEPLVHHLLMMLVSFKNAQTGLCCPNYQTLEKKTGTSHRTVLEGLRELRERGIIIVTRGRHNSYKFNFAQVAESSGELLEGETPDPEVQKVTQEPSKRLRRNLPARSQKVTQEPSSAESYIAEGYSVTPNGSFAFPPKESNLAEQSIAGLGVAQLDPHSGTNGNNNHNISGSSPNPQVLEVAQGIMQEVWTTGSLYKHGSSLPYDPDDIVKLLVKWDSKLEESRYSLDLIMVWMFGTSSQCDEILSSADLEEHFDYVLQTFLKYFAKTPVMSVRRRLANEWIRLHSRSTETPESAVAPDEGLASYLRGGEPEETFDDEDAFREACQKDAPVKQFTIDDEEF